MAREQAVDRIVVFSASKMIESDGDFGSFEQNAELSIKWLRKAADQGSLQAYYFLAKMAYCRLRGDAFYHDESLSPKDIFKYCSIIVKFGSEERKKYIYSISEQERPALS